MRTTGPSAAVRDVRSQVDLHSVFGNLPASGANRLGFRGVLAENRVRVVHVDEQPPSRFERSQRGEASAGASDRQMRHVLGALTAETEIDELRGRPEGAVE